MAEYWGPKIQLPPPAPETRLEQLERELRWVLRQQAEGGGFGAYAKKLKADHLRLTTELVPLRAAAEKERIAAENKARHNEEEMQRLKQLGPLRFPKMSDAAMLLQGKGQFDAPSNTRTILTKRGTAQLSRGK